MYKFKLKNLESGLVKEFTVQDAIALILNSGGGNNIWKDVNLTNWEFNLIVYTKWRKI